MKAFAKILNQTDTYTANLAIAWQNFRSAQNEWKKAKAHKKAKMKAKN
jgi:hypothetical protein